MGLDTKTDRLTDCQSQSGSDSDSEQTPKLHGTADNNMHREAKNSKYV
jgi:hypothetical protein